jgi:CHAT domain-containing protein
VWVTKDGELGLVDGQIDKYGILANVETLVASRIPGTDSHEAAKKSLLWLDMAGELVSQLPEEERVPASAEIQFKASNAYSILDDFPMAIYCLETARLLFTEAGRSREAEKAQKSMALYQLLAVEQAQLDASMSRDQVEATVNESLKNFEQVEDALLNSGFKFQLVQCLLAEAWAWERAFQMKRPGALENALGKLKMAEDIQNSIRSDMTIQKCEEIFQHKSAMVAQTAQLYELGVKLSLAAEDLIGAWEWVQKGKARAFHDLLSFEGTIPSVILKTVHGNEEAQNFLAKEAELLRVCQRVSPEQRFPVRQEIAVLRRKMNDCSALEGLLLYRGMKSITTHHLKGLFIEHQDVVCVDWTTVADRIWMFVIRPGKEPHACELKISAQEVSSWIESNLTAEYMRQPRANERMRMLDPLIAPLAELSNPGKLLVFCPGGMLGALPLHALELGGELLLERNLVTYASSLSVFNHCLLRRSDDKLSLAKITIFGNPTCDRSAAEISSRALAKQIGVEPYIGRQATKAAFQATAEDASAFHYHGHAMFSSTDPLLSALILNQGETNTLGGGNLTAREIIGLRLSIALFVMIACESAQQEIKAGEEPTGLLAMLMLAGVNSVIGTMWKCSDAAGKAFAEEFYSGLLAEFEANPDVKGMGSWFNIAKAMQQAVLAVRKRKPAPYFWALFVLHGNWHCTLTR